MKKNNKFVLISICLIVLITIGYALLSTILTINSDVEISKISFDIYFDNLAEVSGLDLVKVDEAGERIGAAKINENNKQEIDFSVLFKDLGQSYKFTTDIVNDGKIPAKITDLYLSGLSLAQYHLLSYDLSYTVTGTKVNVGDYLLAGERKNITVVLTMDITDDLTSEELESIKEGTTLSSKLNIVFEGVKTSEVVNSSSSSKLVLDKDFMPSNIINFSQPSSVGGESGLFLLESTKNDAYPIYFYRGAVTNNNVVFAGFCWQILRTTNTGGIKLIYNGKLDESGACTGNGSIGIGTFNKTFYNNYYVRKNETSTYNSDAKVAVDTWFYNNLVNYDIYLEDTEFCNDVSQTFYNNYESNVEPDLSCEGNNKMSVGNGLLSYPVALLTGEEAKLAGASSSDNSTFFLKKNYEIWLLTGGVDSGHQFSLNSSGKLYGGYSGYTANWQKADFYYRPVISLSSRVSLEGEGTNENPYTVSLETKNTSDTCLKLLKYTCTNETEQLQDVIEYTSGYCPGDGNYGPRDEWNVLEEGHTSCKGSITYIKN